MYVNDKVAVGQLVYYKDRSRFVFELVQPSDCYIKRLNYQVVENSPFVDKIVYVNHKNICIRNNDNLVYGSLALQPFGSADLRKFTFEQNLHEKLLLMHYDFRFFTEEYVIEALKMNRKYLVYELIASAMKRMQDTGQWSIPFEPELLAARYDVTQREFIEKSGFMSDYDFLMQFGEIIDKVDNPEKAERLRGIHAVIADFNSKAQSFDLPSKIFYMHCARRNVEEVKLRSDIIFCASISDQQDFLLQTFVTRGGPMSVPSWEDMKKYCVVYWYTDINVLREKLDKAALLRYKQNKDVFDVLLWFVLLGKHKLLVPLFKLEKGQERFVNFFGMDFADPKSSEKAVNNGYVLKSQKKFELSAAFFILAKHYIEAIDLLVSYGDNIQLAVLVYRLFEGAINANESSRATFQQLIDEKFVRNGEARHDHFLSAIGYMILKDYPAAIKAVTRYNDVDRVGFVNAMEENDAFFGFYSCNYSPYYLSMLRYIESSPALKRYVSTDQESPSSTHANYYKATMTYYINLGNMYQCLETLAEYKAVDPVGYSDFKGSSAQLVQSCLIRVAMKKLKSLIEQGNCYRLSARFERLRSWCAFFEADFEKLVKHISHRVYLINHLPLSVFFGLSYTSTESVHALFADNLELLLHKCGKLLKIDVMAYHNRYKYLKRIANVRSVVGVINDLFLISDHASLEAFTQHRTNFADLLGFYVFLIALRAHSWTQCLEYIERFSTLDVFSDEFKAVLDRLEEWCAEKFHFNGKTKSIDFGEAEVSFTSLNALCTLFLQSIVFDTFKRIRSASQSTGGVVDTRLANPIANFVSELQAHFVNLLHAQDASQQIQVIDELRTVFTSDASTLRLQNFGLVSPKDAFDLDVNPRISSKLLHTEPWFDFLHEEKLAKILDMPLRGITDELLEQRTAFFRNGIELFKVKSEPGINLFNKGVITDICIFQTSKVPDVFILAHNKIRKVYVFNALFKKQRIEEGYNLAQADDISSLSVIHEAPAHDESTLR